jgi:hypothetical protein
LECDRCAHLNELRIELNEHFSSNVSLSTIWHTLDKIGYTWKISKESQLTDSLTRPVSAKKPPRGFSSSHVKTSVKLETTDPPAQKEDDISY